MIKKKPTFEQSINAAMIWCKAWEAGNLSDEVLADRIGELIATKEGARGFFAISLSSDCPLMDRLPDPVIFQLRNLGESIVELTVKNLAMSSAMTLQHERKNNSEHLFGSKRVTRRCIELLKLLETNSVKKHLESLLSGTMGEGNYAEFLNRWGYDEGQKIAISKSINSVAED